MSAKRKRIPLNPAQPGLNAAFGSLELGGLPPGPETEAAPPPVKLKSGRVVLRRETASRGGKTVIVIDGFAEHHQRQDLEALARRLRTACSGGGAVRERTIEIQGDQPAKIRALLEAEGFQVAGVK